MMWWTTSAFAWNGSGIDWAWQDSPGEEPFWLNVESFEGFDGDDVEVVFERALRTWSVESDADVFLEYGGRSTVLRQGGGDDDVNVTRFGTRDFFSGLAVATTWADGGDLVDCDIAVHERNGGGFIDWHVGSGSAPNGDYDLANTLAHELGHCLGLSHSGLASALMTPYAADGLGEVDRHLTPDDRSGIQALYGAVSPELGATARAERRGDAVVVTLTVANAGDGSAFDVVWSGDGGEVGVGDVGSPTPVGRRVGPDVVEVELEVDDPCPDGEARVRGELVDARGRSTDVDLTAAVDCPEEPEPEPEDTGDTAGTEPTDDDVGGEEPGGCGCSSTAGGVGWLALAGVLGLRRSRRPVP